MGLQARDRAAYEKVVGALRRQSKGATVADIVARTALPLETVRDLVPAAADEYSGRLEVTESGEIRYSFPRGFTSKYRGFRAGLRRAAAGFAKGLRIGGAWAFKVWIMAMLVGYFLFFMLLAVAALALSVAASFQSNSNSRSSKGDGGLLLASSLFNTIIRIWFYSELLNTDRRYSRSYRGVPAKPKGRPLYKAIFSFVFGDDDPNARWDEQEKRAVIAYIQENRGVITTPELAMITGLTPGEAEGRITAYCAEFGGSPEATEDGTVVYRFDDLLLRADRRDRGFGDLSGPIKRLKGFSSNAKKLNGWFAVINGVNLAFGGYFLFNALQSGHILTPEHFQASSWFYGVSYLLLSQVFSNPLPVITIGMGWVPIIFSLIFWAIPALRFFGVKKENERIKLENFRKEGYGRIWRDPFKVNPGDMEPKAAECRPSDLEAARDQVIKEFGAYSIPDAALDAAGGTVYSFADLDREKRALARYRGGIDAGASELGKTVFDSEAGAGEQPRPVD
ncbi:MAG: hypothetical protein LBI91_02055 [Spirochaetaceae bacterium]|jgi:hypothetical protein|nr:hypothetical protein [Spirochaetaceae bacterium]